MSARIVVRQCSTPTNHRIHVQHSRSIHGEPTAYLCGGDSLGDRRIRESDDLASLVREVEDPLGVAFARVTGLTVEDVAVKSPDPIDGPDDDVPSYDSDADVAASRYFGSR